MKTNNTYAILLIIILGVSCNFVKPESNITEMAILDSILPHDCSGLPIRGNRVKYLGGFDDVIIFAGQSNMQGSALSYDPVKSIPGVYIFTGSQWEGYINKPHSDFSIGPDYSFVTEWTIDNPGKTLGIIKLACGGAYMSDWDVTWQSSTAAHPHWGSLINRLHSMYEKAGKPNVSGFVWMQGESETLRCIGSSGYKERTQDLIDWQYDNFPSYKFIMGLTQNIGPCGNKIRLDQQNLTGVSVINIDDLSTNTDGVHLNKSAQIEFGKRLYSAFINE